MSPPGRPQGAFRWAQPEGRLRALRSHPVSRHAVRRAGSTLPRGLCRGNGRQATDKKESPYG